MATGIAVELELMRASALLESDPAAAARLASAILAGSPGHPEAALLLATASQRSGDPAAARAQLESLVRAQPDSLTLQLELARSHAAGGRTTEAIAALQAALALNSGFADGWRELAAQRYLAGDEPGGDAAYGEYSRLATSPPELTDAARAQQPALRRCRCPAAQSAQALA
jgi:predicted Zn-dependent protease